MGRGKIAFFFRLLIVLVWAKVCTYCIMHDSGALRALFLWYVYCVFELKHYLTLNEGFGETAFSLSTSEL